MQILIALFEGSLRNVEDATNPWMVAFLSLWVFVTTCLFITLFGPHPPQSRMKQVWICVVWPVALAVFAGGVLARLLKKHVQSKTPSPGLLRQYREREQEFESLAQELGAKWVEGWPMLYGWYLLWEPVTGMNRVIRFDPHKNYEMERLMFGKNARHLPLGNLVKPAKTVAPISPTTDSAS